MSGAIGPLIWMAILFAALWWTSRRLATYFVMSAYLLTGNEGLAKTLYAIFILPGTIVHETSHWLMAKLVGVRTGNVSIIPKFSSGGSIQLGSVEVAGGNLAQRTLIGLAPLAVGSALTVWLSFGLVDIEALRIAWDAQRWDAIFGVFAAGLRHPDALIAVYLLFAVSDAMFLSASDRQPIQEMVIYLALVLLPLYFLGLLPALPYAWTNAIQTGFEVFAYGLGIALLVHIALALFCGILFYVLREIL